MVKHTQVKARGTSLVEALIALLIVALGLMAMTVIQGRLRQSGDAAKQRTEATRLAQAEMQRLRAYAALRRDASTPSSAAVYAELNDQLVE
ncbi:MAG: type IV pilus modification PilV family protein, partial [Inhella sp.]